MLSRDSGSQRALREANRRRVLEALRASGTATQAELARLTGLSAATVSGIVKNLSADGLLRVTPTVSSGRRARAVSLNPSAGVAAGVDFGRTHVRVALADLAHSFIGEQEVEVAMGTPADEAIALAVDVFRSLIKDVGVDQEAIIGVGAGVPGPIDSRDGHVGHGSILPEWVGIGAAEALSDALALPVTVDNDANLGALAEVTWGAARGYRDAVYVKVETGVGAGLIIGGELYRGAIGMAGEIGHTTLDDDGAVCRCGNRGCLETKASAAIVLDLLASGRGPGLTIEAATRKAIEGDAACARVIGDVGRHVGVALGTLCNLLNPGIVVVDGQLVGAGDILLEPMRNALRRFAIPAIGASTPIVPSELRRRAPSMGAVALALRAASPGVGR